MVLIFLIKHFHSLQLHAHNKLCITFKRIKERNQFSLKILQIAFCNNMNKIRYFYSKCCKNFFFTFIARDNVDLNSSSNTAAGQYHGTSTTVLQFPLSTRPGKIRDIEYELTVSKTLSKKVDKLPQSYTNVIQLNVSKAPLFAPVCRYNIPEFNPDVVEQ